MMEGEQLDSVVIFQLRIFPVISRGPASLTLSLLIACSQLRLVYFCHSLQLLRDTYVTQHTMRDHQRRSLPENNPVAPLFLALPFSTLFLSSLSGMTS